MVVQNTDVLLAPILSKPLLLWAIARQHECKYPAAVCRRVKLLVVYAALTVSTGLDIRAHMTLANPDAHRETNPQDATMILETSSEGPGLVAARGDARYPMHE